MREGEREGEGRRREREREKEKETPISSSLYSQDGRVFIHPSSVNSEKNFPSNWFVYYEKVV